jgi:hypothetical protein
VSLLSWWLNDKGHAIAVDERTEREDGSEARVRL